MAGIDPQRWQRLSPLLDELLALEPSEREGRLAQLQCSHGTLAGRLDSLLAQQGTVERKQFLDGQALDGAETATLAGQTIGAYTLEQPLGSGGMGSVWLARRSDGRFDAKVAIKLLNLALLSGRGAERFAREGTVLARLTHPYIARLLDAGITAGGQPYLVLEHVDGESIDRWCEARALNAPGRVRLMLDVLGAVAHAHSKLILHRDLKPGNIFVTGDGQVKLLDFGIAKLLDDDASAAPAAEATQLSARAFTPDYAAPEQVQGQEVSTATDVYALGVLLYRLLGGGHPTSKPTDTPVDRLRAVVETEPRRLSDAVTADRGTLRGDLDNIVAKALKKAPAQRYATAAALADDLQRYLNHQPVSARADTLAYRVAKFVRRHRVGVLFAGVAATALMLATALAVGQMLAADEQRRVAEEETERAGATRDFLEFVLAEAGATGRPFTTSELLARAERALEFGTGRDRFAVEQLISLGALHVGLGQYQRALELTETARRHAASGNFSGLHRRAGCALGRLFHHTGRMDDAAAMLEATIAELRQQSPAPPALVECLAYQSDLDLSRRRIADALAAAQQAVALSGELFSGSKARQIAPRVQLAIAQRMAGERGAADTTYRETVRLLEATGRERSVDAIVVYGNWAHVRSDLGDIIGALRLTESAFDVGRAVRPDGRPDHVMAVGYGLRLISLNRLDEAQTQFERALEAARAEGDVDMQILSLLGIANLQRERGELAAAETKLETAARFVDGHFPAVHPARTALRTEQGRLHLAQGAYAAASAKFSQTLGDKPMERARTPYQALELAAWAQAELGLGHHERAASLAADASTVAARFALPGEPSYWVGRALLEQAGIEAALGHDDAARRLAARAVPQLEPTVGAAHPATRKAAEFGSH